jgi:hypothetical protein
MDREAIERERLARKEALAQARAEQYAKDLDRLNALEIERGDENVAAVEIGRYSPGLVTMVVVRALSKHELRRFRDRTRGEKSNAASAAEEAAESALLYPERDSAEWSALVDAVPGVLVRAGVAAVQLAAGLDAAEGKE